jgi:bifunctional non-homologous end joining protein LigD
VPVDVREVVFIDCLRNQRGATAVASCSTRARVGAPVATPVRWEELGGRLAPDKYTVCDSKKRLAWPSHDPWDGFFDVDQSVSKSALRPVER